MADRRAGKLVKKDQEKLSWCNAVWVQTRAGPAPGARDWSPTRVGSPCNSCKFTFLTTCLFLWLQRVRTHRLSSEKQQRSCDWFRVCAFRAQPFFPIEPQPWNPSAQHRAVPADGLLFWSRCAGASKQAACSFSANGRGPSCALALSVDSQGMNFIWMDSRKLRWPTPFTSVNLFWTFMNPTLLTQSGGKEWSDEVLSDSRHHDPELCAFEGSLRLQSHWREHPEKQQSQELSGQWQWQAGHWTP